MKIYQKLIVLLFLVLTNSCSILEMGKKQANDIAMLENYTYQNDLDEMETKILKALDKKRSISDAPMIVRPMSDSRQFERENAIQEKFGDEGFVYQGKVFLPDTLEFGMGDLLNFSASNIKTKVMNSISKGKYPVLKKNKNEILISDKNVLYFLSKTENGVQVRSKVIKGIVRGPMKLDLDVVNLLSGKLPFSIEKGAIDLEKSLSLYGERDKYAELEIYYLLTDAHKS